MTFWVAGAVVVAGVGGALISSNASGKASSAAARTAADANQTQWDMYNQTRTDNLPALDARNASLAKLQSLLGIGGDAGAAGYGSLSGPINVGDITKDPGYQFGMDEGQRQITNQMAARGMRNSGAALMAGDRFATDYATTKTDDTFNRMLQNRQQQLNPLLSTGGLAQVGTSQIGQAGQNYADQYGMNARYAGDAAQQNALAQGSIWGNALNQGAGWYMNQNRSGYQPNANGVGYGGSYVNQGPAGGDAYGSYWGIE